MISVNEQTKQASVSENNLWICAAGQSEAALQTRDAVRGDDERRRAGVHSGRHPDEERLGVFSPLPGVQQLPQPAAVWAAGQLRPLSVHAAVRPAGEAWAEGRVRQNTTFCSFYFDMGIHSMLQPLWTKLRVDVLFQTFYQTGPGGSRYNRISSGSDPTLLWGRGESREDTAFFRCPQSWCTDVMFVSVSGVFGHDDSEGAHHQTTIEAVSVPARPAGSQLTWKREGGNISRPCFNSLSQWLLTGVYIIFSCLWFFLFSGADDSLGFSQAYVWEGPAQGLHREVCSELHAAPGPPQPSISAVRSWQRHRSGIHGHLSYLTYYTIILFIFFFFFLVHDCFVKWRK